MNGSGWCCAAVATALVVGLWGCGSAPRYRWEKPGSDRAEFEAARDECVEYANQRLRSEGTYESPVMRTAGAEAIAWDHQRQMNWLGECMERKGFTRVRVEEEAGAGARDDAPGAAERSP